MALTEVYCLVNRARGMEVTLAFTLVPVHVNPTSELLCVFALPLSQLLSPEDLVNACKMFESLKLPLRFVSLHVSEYWDRSQFVKDI